MRVKSYLSVVVFSVATLASSLLSGAGDTDPSMNETGRLNAWLDARYEEELAFSPIKLSTLGRKESYDQINDYSEAAVIARHVWRTQTVDKLKRLFDYQKLSNEGQISYDYWVYRFEVEESLQPFLQYPYHFNQMSGQHTGLPQFLINIHRVDTLQDMNAYIRRIEGVGRAIEQLLVRAQDGAKAGVRPPQYAYDTVIEKSIEIISGKPFDEGEGDSPLWDDANTKIAGLLEAGVISKEAAESLRGETRVALREALQPSYSHLIAWLRKDRDNADEQARGVHALSGGDDYYQARLGYYTTTDMTSAEIHELGLDEVARIRAQMQAIQKQVGQPGSLEDFFDFVRADEQFYFSNDAQGREGYIIETQRHLDWIAQRLPAYFGILPQAALEVRRVDPFLERDGAAAFYKSGTADGARPGTYYLHLSDMTALNTVELETTAYHEGNPGHHMQISIALERDDLPLFRTNERYSAYSEGWALYSELLASEMGAFAEPYSDFGRLVGEMWRAVRLVVDTGIHTQGWSEQKAVDYFMANSSISEVSAVSEIRRYTVWPGQATSYKIGMLKIQALREHASNALGEKFDIRGFHDTILGGGALPLSILERRVDDWIESER